MGVNEHLKNNKLKFDLIIWLYPNQYYLNFDSMLKLCRSSLNEDGALAIPASLLSANNAQGTCKQLFKNKISIPGKSLVYAFSNKALTSNLKVLEKRLDKLDNGEEKMFPPRIFSILYSIPVKTPPITVRQNKGGNENILIKLFNSFEINWHDILIILAFSSTYFIGRFFLLRRKSLYAATGLFENGLCLMLIMMVLITQLAHRDGSFYYNFGVILTAISGAPMGMFFSQFKLRRLAVIMSVIIIFLSSLRVWEYYSSFIPGIAYINYICGGIIVANIFKQNPDSSVKLLSIHFLACALAGVLMFTLLIMHFNIFTTLFIIIIFRIPLIFSKMTLGKFDVSGDN